MHFFDDSEEWSYEPALEAVIFYVNVHNLLYRCVVTREAVETRYGRCLSEKDVLACARENSQAITDQLSALIRDAGYRNRDGIITLQSLM